MAPRLPLRAVELGRRLGRLGLFLTVVCVGLELLLARAVRADVDHALLDLGAGLAQLAGPGEPARPGQPRVLELNGNRLHFDTGTRADAVGEVLDQAEASCADPGARRMRGEDGRRGFVACLARVAAPEGAPAYRYVYAQPGAERTQVVRFWTDGPLDLEALLPEAGDAPGSDAPDVPRPPGARRILSARELGEPQQITLYETGGAAPRDLAAWYRERLAAIGWRPLEPAAGAGGGVLVVGRGGSLAALVFSVGEAGDGGGTVAILTSLSIDGDRAKDKEMSRR